MSSDTPIERMEFAQEIKAWLDKKHLDFVLATSEMHNYDAEQADFLVGLLDDFEETLDVIIDSCGRSGSFK